MSKKDDTSQHPKPALASRVDELRVTLQRMPVDLLERNTGIGYQAIGPGRGEFRFSLFGLPILMTHPGFVGVDVKTNDELPLPSQAVLAYYFYTADGTPLTGQWVSFGNLPDGRMYNRAFQGYSGDVLVKSFGLNVDTFKVTCEKNGGDVTSAGDAAYIFHALPRLPLLINYWCGDEDFPSTCKVLFDSSVSHYLPTDVCAILGSMLTRRLVKNRL